MCKTNSTRINTAIVVFFILMCLIFLSLHENWRDEAQSWLLAQVLSPSELIAQMKYEGHPCLWHFILMPFAKSGFPYITTNLISIFFVTIAVALILWKSPVSIVLKLVLIFGSALSYFYGVVSRSYCLIPVFLFLSAVFYSDRHAKPIRYGLSIALLVQTHIIMLPTAGLLSIFFLVEAISTYMAERDGVSLFKKGIGLSLPLISLIFLIFQVGGAAESSAFSIQLFSLTSFIRSLGSTCLRYWSQHQPGRIVVLVALILFAVCSCCILYAGIIALRKRNKEAVKAMLIACISIGCQVFFSAIMYAHNEQRYFTFLFIWFWLIWVLWPANGKKNSLLPPLVAVFLLLSVASYQGYGAVYFDVKASYSGSKECAQFINTRIPEDAVILQSDTPRFSAVVPYLDGDYQIFSFETGKDDKFATWKHTVPIISTIDEATQWVKENYPDASEYWVVIPFIYKVSDEVDNSWFETMEPYHWLFGPEKKCLEFENYSSQDRIREEVYAICRIGVM